MTAPDQTGDPTAVGWADLVAQATLGTARRPQRVVGTVADITLPPAHSAEQSILAAAAALGAARRATMTPMTPTGSDVPPTGGAAPQDVLPVAPARAGQLLEVILGGEVVSPTDAGPLLMTWLQTCADTGYRVAPAVLPRILDRVISGGLDPVVTARAVGVRGRWLASLHTGWASLAQPLMDADLDTLQRRLAGPAAQEGVASRPAALAVLRRQDLLAAGSAVVALWPRASVVERQAVLAVVAADLDPDDEPWLEAALSDPSPRVGRTAARLLARLPDSRRAGRMAERLQAITDVTRVRLRRRLLIGRPDPPNDADLRDATDDPPAEGVAAWWQAQIIRGAPLLTWERLVGGVGRVVPLLAEDTTLLCLVADATALQRNPAWHGPVLTKLLDGVGLGTAQVEQVTPGSAREAELQARAARVAAIGRLAGSLPTPWDRQTSRSLLTWVLAHPTPGLVLTQLRPVLAAGLGPDMTEVLRGHEGYRGSDERQVVQSLTRLRHVLSLRHEIGPAFATATTTTTTTTTAATATATATATRTGVTTAVTTGDPSR